MRKPALLETFEAKAIASAEKSFVLRDEGEILLPVRKTAGDDLGRLDRTLVGHPYLRVKDFRTYREAKVSVGRPALLAVDRAQVEARHPEWERVRSAFDEARRRLSSLPLSAFLRANYKALAGDPARLVDAAAVYAYLVEKKSEVRGLYPRQVAHGRSTKIIGRDSLLLSIHLWASGLEVAGDGLEGDDEDGSGLTELRRRARWRPFFEEFGLAAEPCEYPFYAPLITFDVMTMRGFSSLISQEVLHRIDFSGIKAVLLTENKTTYYAIRELLPPQTMVIQAGGYGVTGLAFLKSGLLPATKVFYSGDLDADGYAILALVCEIFPGIVPLLMDQETYQRHAHVAQGSQRRRAVRPILPAGVDASTRSAMNEVVSKDLRIEQEQIDFTFAKRVILAALADAEKR